MIENFLEKETKKNTFTSLVVVNGSGTFRCNEFC